MSACVLEQEDALDLNHSIAASIGHTPLIRLRNSPRGLPAGVIHLRVVRVTRAGKRITTNRTYYPCGHRVRTRGHGRSRRGGRRVRGRGGR